MRWRNLVLLCGVFSLVTAEPEPKKYSHNSKEKQAYKSNSSLTEEEREFLKEVESKFGIKTDVKTEKPKLEGDNVNPTEVTPFPAVIAIEIVNDTEVDSKGKRTIDANLGYGYKTNTGYMYSYFGKPSQEKGKFMIYPYSQEDIPPAKPAQYQQSLGISSTPGPQSQQHYDHPVNTIVSDVEIQQSHAYELIPVQEQSTYNFQEPLTEVHTKYEKVVGQEVPPPIPTQYSIPESTHHVVPSSQSTLYTTYSGGQLSSLSGSFPYVMPHYFVDSSQLLRHPQFRSAGLTSEHLQAHGHQLTQRIVPVLILRIPSSQLTSPTAELYPNLPQNYPLSQQLNSVNLQKLVQQYFNKNSYSHAPPILTYSAPSSPTSTPVVNFGTQPHTTLPIQQHPSYTYADYSGIQYSGVQPVMAKYPTTSGNYPTQYYYSQNNPQYHQLAAQPQYKYQYQYIQPAQSYYTKVQPQYQSQTLTQIQSYSPQVSTGHKSVVVYEPEATPQVMTEYENPKEPAPEYETPSTPEPVYGVAKETQQPQHQQAVYSQANEDLSAQTGHVQYNTESGENVQKETLAIYPTQTSHNPHQQYQYVYQQPLHMTSSGELLKLTENYPSPDHTIAKIFPSNSYPLTSQGVTQKINYVTPSPHLVKHPYRVMVPQIVLRNNQKVAHVYSQPLPQYTPSKSSSKEQVYKGPTYLPSIESQRPATYPANYHSHPRRMTGSEKTEANSTEDTISIRDEKEKS